MTAPALLLAQTAEGPPHLLVVGLVAAVAAIGALVWRAARHLGTRRRDAGREDDRG